MFHPQLQISLSERSVKCGMTCKSNNYNFFSAFVILWLVHVAALDVAE